MCSQKQMLEEYALKNGLPNPTHFTYAGMAKGVYAITASLPKQEPQKGQSTFVAMN